MKKILIACPLFFFALASTNYAAAKESGSVSFPNAVRIGNATLPAGSYTVHWTSGSDEVTLMREGKTVSVPATEAESAKPGQVYMHRDGDVQVVDGFTIKSTGFTIKKK